MCFEPHLLRDESEEAEQPVPVGVPLQLCGDHAGRLNRRIDNSLFVALQSQIEISKAKN